jgi:hypothetical protein
MENVEPEIVPEMLLMAIEFEALGATEERPGRSPGLTIHIS